MADGVPVPTITWTKPDGSQLKQETSSTSRANVELKSEADFGQYKCSADNGFISPDVLTNNLVQISKLPSNSHLYKLYIEFIILCKMYSMPVFVYCFCEAVGTMPSPEFCDGEDKLRVKVARNSF